ncbi:hypothetical protein FSP39_003071 [Pinctada imbricata]|uniref:Uncharacterized protein n=1 Tax=Pinctada imbricata TaxID=66713 RepID=A0AA89BNC2_PINIB|nr:hypothetical protein FSP39_003071 [Pinctada imbricata]
MEGSSYLAILFTVFLTQIKYAQSAGCQIPADFHGSWFSMGQAGEGVTTNVDGNGWKQSTEASRLTCQQIHKNDVTGTTVLMKSEDSSNTCTYCINLFYRTSNIIQVRQGPCLRGNEGMHITQRCNTESHIPNDVLSTFFRTTPRVENCKSTFDGLYTFSYEAASGGGGVCNNPGSRIKACQDPGSSYVDNQVFLMTYKSCPDVSASMDKKVRYQCMGSWSAKMSGVTYKFAAIADTVEKDNKEKYKCLMTIENQRNEDKKIRWAMSRFADCSSLNSIFAAPLRLVLAPRALSTPITQAKCKLPPTLKGDWSVELVEYNARVKITEDKLILKPDAVDTEISYSCQSKPGSIYVMTKTIEGKCEATLVCVQLEPKKDGSVTFMVGMPTTVNANTYPNLQQNDFLSVCSGSFLRSKVYKLTAS